MCARPTLADLGENALVESIFRWLPEVGSGVVVGPGDDCAVLAGEGGTEMLLKTDCVVEGLHYHADAAAVDVGRKAIGRVLSDIAAMGGEPGASVVTLAAPASTPLAWVEELYAGMREMTGRWGGAVVGGETTCLPEGAPVLVNVAMTGSVPAGGAWLRSGGRPGDILCVTGRLGGAVRSGRHMVFTPRLREALWLRGWNSPTAAMDLSDGLAADLPRLAKASGCGYVIDRRRIPRQPDCDVAQALGDGEDYELLMAFAPEDWTDLPAAWDRVFPGVPLTAIGELVEAGDPRAIDLEGGWQHFAAGSDEPQ